MTKILYDNYDKAAIADLPPARFEGKIVEITSEADARKAVPWLLRHKVLGFDTETKPNFRKGGLNPVALMQVSTHHICFLFRLCRMGITQSLSALLADESVTKVGLSWHDDMQQLRRLGGESLRMGEFVDVQDLARSMGITAISLQNLFANVCGGRISKTQRLTNWERGQLTEQQRVYAATDAWACVVIYEELMRLRASGDYELRVTPEQASNAVEGESV